MEKHDLLTNRREYTGRAKIDITNKRAFSIQLGKNTIVLILASILLGRANILGGLAPFGLAFFISLLAKEKGYGYIGLGVLLGMLTVPEIEVVKYAISFLCAWGVFIRFGEKIPHNTLILSALSSMLLFIPGLLYSVLKGFYIYDLFMLGFESVVVFVFVYILSFSIPIVLQKNSRKILSNEEMICIAISGAVAISGLSNMAFMGYSIKTIIGILLTLIFAYNGGASVGAGVGITIGVITSMSTIGTPTVIGIYGFSGLLAGVFKDLGKLGAGLGIVLGNAILTFYINGSTEVIIRFQEILGAFIAFMFMPKPAISYMEKFVNSTLAMIQLDKSYSERIKKLIYDRLREYSTAFSELSVTYGNILEKNTIVEQRDVAEIVDQVVNKVCKSCGMCRGCWNNNFYSMYNGIVDTIAILESDGRVYKGRIPENLRKRCIRVDELIQAVTDMFEIFKIHYNWQKRLFESRQLVAEQFKGISHIIEDLAQEVNDKIDFKTEVEDALYVAFDKEGHKIQKVSVLVKENGKFEIELEKRACFDRKQCDDKIAPIVSKVVGKEVVRSPKHCTAVKDQACCSFKLVEAEKYRIMTGVARAAKDNLAMSGDHYSFVELKDGKYMMALSDGMGSGEKAGKESMATVTLLEQLMEAGFDKDVAIKTINSILVLKSSEEIFATMDLSMVDLYSGKVEFVKIGAASSFIKRASGEVEIIKSSSLPIGILNKIDIESFGKKLHNGDFIIMMSDGILDADKAIEEKEKWVVSYLKQSKSRNPQMIADELLDMAIQKYGNRIEDDMTVLVSKIWEA